MYCDYFSIGEYCATAAQIRRVSGRQSAYFFDWLVTPGASFDFFAKPMQGFLRSGNWDIVGEPGNEGIRVRDLDSQLLFQHEFPTLDGKIDRDRVEAHLDTAREKFSYLRRKTEDALRSTRCGVLIRAENGLKTADDALARMAQIRSTFMPINPGLKVVIASTGFSQEFEHPDCLLLKLKPSAEWFGDFPSWDRLFQIAESKIAQQGSHARRTQAA